jgi:hypothetical protein
MTTLPTSKFRIRGALPICVLHALISWGLGTGRALLFIQIAVTVQKKTVNSLTNTICILQATSTDRVSSAITDCHQPVNDCILAVAFLHQTAFSVWFVDFQVEDHRALTYLPVYTASHPECCNLNIHYRDNFKSHIIVFLLYKLEKKSAEQNYTKCKQFSVKSFVSYFHFWDNCFPLLEIILHQLQSILWRLEYFSSHRRRYLLIQIPLQSRFSTEILSGSLVPNSPPFLVSSLYFTNNKQSRRYKQRVGEILSFYLT